MESDDIDFVFDAGIADTLEAMLADGSWEQLISPECNLQVDPDGQSTADRFDSARRMDGTPLIPEQWM